MRIKRGNSIWVSLSIIFVLSGLAHAASGDVDPSFAASAFGTPSGGAAVRVIRKQSDGKILVGGNLLDVNGHATSGLVRLNADGSVDTSFVAPDFYDGSGIGFTVLSLAVQADGKILVGGSFLGVDLVPNPGVRRLNTDGSLDSTFTVASMRTDGGFTVRDIRILPDGKILVAGDITFVQSASCVDLCRLNSDGTLDTSYSSPSHSLTNAIELQPDGKVLVAAGASLSRRNTNLTIDDTFSPVAIGGGAVKKVRPLGDGRILITGSFTNVGAFNVKGIARINADGSLDLTFNQNNAGIDFGSVEDLAIQSDGKIVIVGSFSAYNGAIRELVARLNADGTLDASFFSTPPVNVIPSGLAVDILPDGKTMVGGQISDTGAFQDPPTSALYRLNSDGSVDNSILLSVARSSRVRRTAVQPDGKILIGGMFRYVDGVKRNGLARLNVDGTLDTTFVPYFNKLAVTQKIWGIALMPDGKIMVAGDGGISLKRLNSDGSQDTGFVPQYLLNGDTFYDVVPLADGGVLAVGRFTGFGPSVKRIAKYSLNGSVDPIYATNQPNALVYRVALQPDGKAVFGGDFTAIGATGRGRIARLNLDGTLDATFNPPGGVSNTVYNLLVQPDGKILFAGDFHGVNGSSAQQNVGRMNADGSLDTSFVPSVNAVVFGLDQQADGKILIGGRFDLVSGNNRLFIARLNANGTLDVSFDPTTNGEIWDVNLQADGKILAGGDFSKMNGTSHVRIARLLNTSVAPGVNFDFDGDGRADISVTRTGGTYTWYQLLGATHTFSQVNFGQAGDIVVPADFDGDRKTDIAIFRPSSGQWWYLSSIDGTQKSTTSGANGDIPLPSDFNGDGKADFVLYRPSTQQWWRLDSGGVITSNLVFGSPGDKPLIGDFDGDGKSDPAIFRPSTGQWWYAASSQGNTALAFQWGVATDISAPADYDGDGKTDFAIFRPSDGVWWIRNSNNGSISNVTWGTAGDKPIPADYDGDGRADTAVFRPSNGTWYLLTSSSGFSGFQWGISTDVPSPGAFVPQ